MMSPLFKVILLQNVIFFDPNEPEIMTMISFGIKYSQMIALVCLEVIPIEPKPMGGAGGRSAPPPQETICRKILLSCRNFCDLSD